MELFYRQFSWCRMQARRQHFLLMFSRLKAWKAQQGKYNSINCDEIIRRLSLTATEIPASAGVCMVSQIYRKHIEVLLRQKLVMDTLYSSLLPELMCHIHYPDRLLSMPLPPAWRKALKARGVCFNPLSSRFNWVVFQGKYFIIGLRRAAQLIRDCGSLQQAPEGGYAVLMNLPTDAVPHELNCGEKRVCFVSWYDKSMFRTEGETIYAHVPGANNEYRRKELLISPHPFPKLESALNKLEFFGKAVWLLLVTLVQFVFGKWWAPLLLEDAVQLKYMQCVGKEKLAQKYLFNNSVWARRPLWTYYAEQKGCRIIMAFYSTNITPSKGQNGISSSIVAGYEIMSWPEYAVWDKDQCDFICSVTKDKSKTVHITGPIPMSDSGSVLPEIPVKSIAVFDVSVFRPGFLASLGVIVPYYTSKVVMEFLLETHRAISQEGWTMILKQKRIIGSKADKDYIRLIEKLSCEDNVLIIEPDINAERVIKKVAAVISIPYTSTALLGIEAGKPSIYYDAMAQLKIENRAKHGIRIFDNVSSLTKWISDLRYPRSADEKHIDKN
ncbi:MAG: polysaccharide biosynthesis PFTS motif protein [Halopseudomonas aestusnigri]